MNLSKEERGRRSAQMAHQRGDPTFLAKCVTARRISPARRAAIVDALRAEPNGKSVARKFSVSYDTVLRIVKAEGLSLKKGGYRPQHAVHHGRIAEEKRRKRGAARAVLMKCIRRQSGVKRRDTSAEVLAAIAAALRLTPNAAWIARRFGVSSTTVKRMAKAEGVRLRRGRPACFSLPPAEMG